MKHAELCFLVHDTARLMRRRFDALAAGSGVTRAQWQMLWELSRNQGCNQTTLAELLEIETITLCRMADRLQAAGLIERRADPADRRAWRLFLTADAAPLMQRAEGFGACVTAQALAGVDDDAADWVVETLGQVRANLATPQPGRRS